MNTVVAAGVLLGVAFALDAMAAGGWKDRAAFVLIILGVTVGWAQSQAAANLAGLVGAALAWLFTLAGDPATRQDSAVALACFTTLLVLVGAAMLMRDTPIDGAEGAGRYHSRLSCSTKRQSRLNPRIWVMGGVIGLLAPQADFMLALLTFLEALTTAGAAFFTSLGAAT